MKRACYELSTNLAKSAPDGYNLVLGTVGGFWSIIKLSMQKKK